MIRAIVVDDEPKARELLANKLTKNCPQVLVIGIAESAEVARDLVDKEKPDLVFLDVAMPGESGFDFLKKFSSLDFEIIFVTGFNDYALDAIKFCAIGYVLKPIRNADLIEAVDNAHRRILDKRMLERNQHFLTNINNPGSPSNRIGIPTTEGLEFVSTSEIIRCEGVQRCTKVHLTSRKSLISSYNLGVFVKLLKGYGFYDVHKSHLINLAQIKRYNRTGEVEMLDNSVIPVSRRRRNDFLEQLQRI